MQVPLQISFRNMEPSDSVATVVREKAAKLEKFFDRISSCRVMIEAPHRSHQQGKKFHVRVDLKVPGKEIVAGGDTSGKHSNEDIRVVLRDTFSAVQRQLQDYVRTLPGYQVRHAERQQGSVHGRVLRLIQLDDEYGFLESVDGREIYFHRNSVLDGKYDQLKPGMEVRFAEENGENGPQASTVEIVGKDNHDPQLGVMSPSSGI